MGLYIEVAEANVFTIESICSNRQYLSRIMYLKSHINLAGVGNRLVIRCSIPSRRLVGHSVGFAGLLVWEFELDSDNMVS